MHVKQRDRSGRSDRDQPRLREMLTAVGDPGHREGLKYGGEREGQSLVHPLPRGERSEGDQEGLEP
jgi:hypothetical protein